MPLARATISMGAGISKMDKLILMNVLHYKEDCYPVAFVYLSGLAFFTCLEKRKKVQKKQCFASAFSKQKAALNVSAQR
tara:strand:- start:332 stop:568 length:237 start_codon:yes stop_codon:yes gene_type:complete